MEGRSGKRSSSVGNEKMERVVDRQGQMERYCSTGQSPQWVVAPTEEEEEKEEFYFYRLVTNDIMKSYNIYSMTSRVIGML
jgi:hypothetical protein